MSVVDRYIKGKEIKIAGITTELEAEKKRLRFASNIRDNSPERTHRLQLMHRVDFKGNPEDPNMSKFRDLATSTYHSGKFEGGFQDFVMELYNKLYRKMANRTMTEEEYGLVSIEPMERLTAVLAQRYTQINPVHCLSAVLIEKTDPKPESLISRIKKIFR